MDNINDRVQGILIGLAAGDRNGGPIRMAIRLAESLAIRGKVDFDHISHSYLDWWRNGAFDTGPVAANVLKLVATGASFKQAVIEVDKRLNGMTAGCNPAHRNVPLAMASFIADKNLAHIAKRETSFTHRHQLAGDVAAATVTLCRHLIHGANWMTALQKTKEGNSLQIRQLLNVSPEYSPKRGGFAPDVLGAAVYFVGNSETFEEALNKSLAFAGAANYCPVLVGSIGGARWGAINITRSATAHCAIIEKVRTVSNILAEQWTQNDKRNLSIP